VRERSASRAVRRRRLLQPWGCRLTDHARSSLLSAKHSMRNRLGAKRSASVRADAHRHDARHSASAASRVPLRPERSVRVSLHKDSLPLLSSRPWQSAPTAAETSSLSQAE
jgi:hypothetical protein